MGNYGEINIGKVKETNGQIKKHYTQKNQKGQ